MKPAHGSCCSLCRPMMDLRRNEGVGTSVCSLQASLVPGPVRLIVSCHCQLETKACDLSMCRVTSLKTVASLRA